MLSAPLVCASQASVTPTEKVMQITFSWLLCKKLRDLVIYLNEKKMECSWGSGEQGVFILLAMLNPLLPSGT